MGPSGLESVRCWGRGGAGVPGRRSRTSVSDGGGGRGNSEASTSEQVQQRPRSSIAAPHGSDEMFLPTPPLPDGLNLCFQPLQSLCFIAALSRSGGVKTRDYTVSGVPF